MSQESTDSEASEWMSIRELTERLQLIHAESAHLVSVLPKDSVHHRVLRLADIARYIGIHQARLGDIVRRRPGKVAPALQRDLTRFFRSWDRDMLTKARVDGQWKLVPRHPGHGHPTLAQMDAPPGSATRQGPVHEMKVDPLTGRLSLLPSRS